jgi:hypothetical protein
VPQVMEQIKNFTKNDTELNWFFRKK